jgi:hypothetical protein
MDALSHHNLAASPDAHNHVLIRHKHAGSNRLLPLNVLHLPATRLEHQCEPSPFLEFPYQAFICGFRVTDKEQHQNHSNKWNQPSHNYDRIESVSRSSLSRVRKMPH